MKIVIHASELNEVRIDGTRIYLSELLKRFYRFSNHGYTLYHKGEINPVFNIPNEKYNLKKLQKVPMWTQSIFAYNLFGDKQDLVWMPVQNLPRIRPKKIKSVVTIHDLAFKKYPHMFLPQDTKKLNFHTDYAVKNATHLIAVSSATKKDLLKYYPKLKEENISIIHHGFDAKDWRIDENSAKKQEIFDKFKITKKFVVYVGAVQPRKNLIVLIEAFEALKKKKYDLQLVCVGADAWKAEETHERALKSKYREDMIFTGGVSFLELKVLLSSGEVFVLPSIHEGFGLPILEAFACETPVIASNSGSLPEVVGSAGELFNPKDSSELEEKLEKILNSQELREKLIKMGIQRLENFSWDESTKKTIAVFDKV